MVNKKNLIIIFIFCIVIFLTITFQTIIFGALFFYIIYIKVIKPREKIKKQKKWERENLKKEFVSYAKNIILLSYTRTLKEAYKNANYGLTNEMTLEVNKFLEDIEYNFTAEPYMEFANVFNQNEEDINYEKHIMIMFYELNKKGMGSKYIDDLISEIQKLEDNNYGKEIYNIKQEEWKYNIIPLLVNFIYVSFVLMKIINNIMKSVFIT